MRYRLLAFVTLCTLTGCREPAATNGPEPSPTPATAGTVAPVDNEAMVQGRRLFEKSFEKLPGVQAKLHCSSCHLSGGTAEGAAPLVGVASYYSGDGALEEKINGCVRENLNGEALAADSPEMAGLLAYLKGLHQDPPPTRGLKLLAPPAQAPDRGRGQALFVAKCQDCHLADGSGQYPQGKYKYPALWGDHSFTMGSALAKPENLAAFITVKMPLGQGQTLTEQEAWDIASFVTSQPRPKAR